LVFPGYGIKVGIFNSKGFSKVSKGGKRMVLIGMLGVLLKVFKGGKRMGQFRMLGVLSKGFFKSFQRRKENGAIWNARVLSFFSKGFSKIFKGGKRMGQFFGMLGARVLDLLF